MLNTYGRRAFSGGATANPRMQGLTGLAPVQCDLRNIKAWFAQLASRPRPVAVHYADWRMPSLVLSVLYDFFLSFASWCAWKACVLRTCYW